MKSMRKGFVFWGLFLLSLAVALFYLNQREKVFPVPPTQYQLSQNPDAETIHQLLAPYVNIETNKLDYRLDTFVDRNAVKFLQKTLSPLNFETVLEKENIPLWGWLIHIQKPFQANLKISHQKKLIGFEMLTNPEYLDSSDRRTQILNLQSQTSKILSDDEKNLSNLILSNDLHLQKQIPGTQLMESITINFDKNSLTKFESNLLLPVTYANIANADIQKQKTMHQFFSIFHYILIALIFLFLFRAYETHLLPWRKNLPIFLALYFSHFFNNFLGSNSDLSFSLIIIQSLVKAIGTSSWMYALIVAADLTARTFQKSNYSLSDITCKNFLISSMFRKSLLMGWLLFVGQLLFVGMFYRFFQNHGAYVPLKIPGEHSISQGYEFLRYFFDSFSTAIFEEVLYRLFLICLFASAFKKTWPAVLISSVLWGFLHFSYQFDPYYVRGLELTMIGIAYGVFMVRYGILSVIFAHFLYNSFVMSEYENQFALYLTCIFVLLFLIYLISYFFRSHEEKFKFTRFDFPRGNSQSVPSTERRNIVKRIYPLNWKYGLSILFVVILIILQIPTPEHDNNPLANKDKLILASSKLISAYEDTNVWNITYNVSNPGIDRVRKKVLDLPNREKLINDINFYSYLWSIRYYSKLNTKTICEFNFTRDYELVRLECPYSKNGQTLSFDDWIQRIKNPDETWTLFNIKPFDNGTILYQYTIAKDIRSPIIKSAFLTFQNNQLIHFKKQMEVLEPNAAKIEKEDKNIDFISVALSIAFIAFIYGFFRFFFSIVKVHSFKDKKPIYGAAVSCIIYAVWKFNAYKEFLIDLNDSITWRHLLFNEIVFFSLKCLALGFVSYLIFYAFIYFPEKIFKHVPSSAEWTNILKRPIWKWRNTKVSLLYAFLLICIQTLLRLLIQINNGMPELELFHFDISYLNHEFIFITFIGLFWKNLVFWILLMVVISVVERYMPRWIYLSIICLIVFANIWLSESDMNSKLIELCGIYIVFYFVYNVARFDFAFYFWFVLLNTLMTFVPIVLYKQFSAYIVQMLFIFIFVSMMMIYTIFQKSRVLKLN